MSLLWGTALLRISRSVLDVVGPSIALQLTPPQSAASSFVLSCAAPVVNRGVLYWAHTFGLLPSLCSAYFVFVSPFV